MLQFGTTQKRVYLHDSGWFRVGFPPGMAGREISREIRGFGISRFPGNLCRDPGKFSYTVPD